MNLATKIALMGSVSAGNGTGASGGSVTTLPTGVFKTTTGDGRTVYHYGTLFSGAVANHLPAYTDNGDTTPAHYWNSRWTHRTNPIVVSRTPAQLVAAHRMFPLGATGCNYGTQPARVPYTIMGAADVTKYMPTTGERPDIGLITDNSGWYMLGGSNLPMIDWAQANESFPLFFRDETTGKPVSLLTYPQANAADAAGLQGAPWLDKGPPDATSNGYHVFGGGFRPQQAHFCEMSYVAHQATLDLGFLENVQYNANFTVLCDASLSNASRAIPSGEYRGLAWAFRNLFMAHISTYDAEVRGDLPATCHPSSYFDTILDNTLAYYSASMTDPAAQTFRLIGGNFKFGPWQVDYMLSALAFGVLTGHSDWTPLYLWCLGNVIARTNGTSGYPPGVGTGYYLNTGTGWTWKTTFDSMVGDVDGGMTQAQHDSLVAPAGDPLNGGRAMQGNEYMFTTRAVLTMADYLDDLGLAAVRSTYPSFDTCLTNANNMFHAYGGVNPRVSVIAP